MKKILYIILFYNVSLFGFEINGQPDNRDINHFLGFDKVGDCLSDIGDITSVFSHIENEKLFLRVTFDDMYN